MTHDLRTFWTLSKFQLVASKVKHLSFVTQNSFNLKKLAFPWEIRNFTTRATDHKRGMGEVIRSSRETTYEGNRSARAQGLNLVLRQAFKPVTDWLKTEIPKSL